MKQRFINIVYSLGFIGLITPVLFPQASFAQRPFRVHDPFYQGETARRAFYDGYAFTTELSMRAPGSVKEGSQTLGSDFFALSFWLDYELFAHIDLSAIVDASGGNSGRTLTLSWLAVKYYRTVESTDYAFRLAVDPSFDARLGSPQLDFAFISTSLLSPLLSSDNAIGIRRVRLGFEQYVPRIDESMLPDTSPVEGIDGSVPTFGDIVYTRALGWEFHFMTQYALLLNPARSNIFVSLQVDRGQYELLETSLRRSNEDLPVVIGNTAAEKMDEQGASETLTEQYRGGAVWFRSGLEYNKPGYQISPFLSIPIKQWNPPGEEGLFRISAGLRFMLR